MTVVAFGKCRRGRFAVAFAIESFVEKIMTGDHS